MTGNSEKKNGSKSLDPHYRAPESSELIELQRTRNLYKSNLFRLQIEELLQSVKVDYAKQKTLRAFMFALKEKLETLPSETLCEGETPSECMSFTLSLAWTAGIFLIVT